MAGCEAIVNFAAETHVDRSIADPEGFIVTNMQGTHVLLEAARGRGLRYLQVSTDEVYGSIEEGSFTEFSPLAPSSPYSATKTGADLLVSSYFHTYGLETLICRGSNNYGPHQYPEKADPVDGPQRAWRAIRCRFTATGETCAIGSSSRTSREASAMLWRTACRARYTTAAARMSVTTWPSSSASSSLTGRDESLIEFVTDRPGHDRRYSLSSAKLQTLGWKAGVRFGEGLVRTVDWYRDNAWWWEPIRSKAPTATITSVNTAGP